MINKNVSKVFLLLIFIFFTNSLCISGQEKPEVQVNPSLIGVYQIILEGVSGTGGLTYRLDFQENGKVVIEKKFNGRDEREVHQWSSLANSVKVLPIKNSVINDFDSATLSIIGAEDIRVDLNVTGESLGLVEDNTKFTLLRWHKWRAITHIALTLIVLLLLNEIFRHFKWSGFAFFVGLTTFFAIFIWPNSGVTYWFKWAKVYSVASAAIFFLLMRFTKIYRFRIPKILCVAFLAVNILEAVMQDFSMGFLPNIFNGIAGVLSILTCFYGWKSISTDKSPQKDMVWPKMTVLWIIAYDVWNYAYVYMNFPGSASAQLMVLLAATIPALFIKKGTWLQARTYTLAVWFIFYFTFTRFYERNLLIFPRNTGAVVVIASISLILNILCFAVLLKNLFQKNGSEEGFSNIETA